MEHGLPVDNPGVYVAMDRLNWVTGDDAITDRMVGSQLWHLICGDRALMQVPGCCNRLLAVDHLGSPRVERSAGAVDRKTMEVEVCADTG